MTALSMRPMRQAPQAYCSNEPSHLNMGGRALVAYGDPTQVETWSGIPYFFLEAGRRGGLLAAGVVLRPKRLQPRRLVWDALQLPFFNRPRGYMFSRACSNSLWRARRVPCEVNEYISHFPLLPPRELVHEPITYYLDATLRYWFDDYGFRVGKRVRDDALARERDAYHSARFVVCMSRWCADDVKSFYNLPAERVRVVLPGANIPETAIPPAREWNGDFSPLRLGFIGADWSGKGGTLLLDAAVNLDRMGFPVEVVVIGSRDASVPDHPLVRSIGFIDKSHDIARFVKIVRTFHFGCLLSRAEALGISTLECLRLGIPVIGRAVGGIVDTIPTGAGFLLPADEHTSERLTEVLVDTLRAPERYMAMRNAAEAAGKYCVWDRTASDFLTLLES